MLEPTFHKTYRYKLRPTPAQEQEMETTLWRCRTLYNTALVQRKTLWEQRGASLSQYDQSAELPDLKAALPEYRAVHSTVLQEALTRLDRAFAAFFRRVNTGAKAGYPRFRGRARYNSFTYKQYGNGASLDNGFLVLSKIGRVAVRWSRPVEGIPKTVTIRREVDGWYATIACADVPVQPLPLTGQSTGIDLGLESFATLADGSMVHNPRHYRAAQHALRIAQRRVSRRVKWSKRRKKAVVLLAKAHQHVRRQRQDFHHKVALALVQQYDMIVHEDLQIATMVKNHHLAKSIADAGWGAFLTTLTYKAACAGKRVVAVNPVYTSQACSGCGVLVEKGLSVRWHSCPHCGTSLHRDHNAARNILHVGQCTLGPSVQAST